ncbi:MAG: radical SAM protein [Chloroflexi bacterium]|nr:radical SAM protein [Chloroflexota bacterium]
MIFGRQAIWNLARGLIFRSNPVYVQLYVTARCNLTCKQCNVIYANAGVREATTAEIDRMAENLRRIGAAIVLLTGGEPFLRQDLPAIVQSFERRGIHVRTQTNGLATREQLAAAVAAGARDISISLDSLLAGKQDFLNGSYRRSWLRAIEAIALVTQTFPARDTFAAFGTVLSPHNILEIPNIIRFATAIGWQVSLVPAHISTPGRLFNFRSDDREMIFPPELYPAVDRVLAECRQLKRQGYALYDSEEYLDNIRLFIQGKPIQWRRRNGGRCDSPALYFAIRPNGDLQVCCDHVLRESYPVWHDEFPAWYHRGVIRRAVQPFTEACSGCMYGSFPEVSITSHYRATLFERTKVFGMTGRPKPWPLSTDDLLAIVERINREHRVPTSHVTEESS